MPAASAIWSKVAPAKAVGGEDVERGFENDVALFALDTRARPFGGAFHQQSFPTEQVNRNWSKLLDHSLPDAGAHHSHPICATKPLTACMAVLTFVHPVKF